MAKRQRWLIRIALEIDGGLTTANKALDEVAAIRKAVEDAGYLIYDSRAALGPLAESSAACPGAGATR